MDAQCPAQVFGEAAGQRYFRTRDLVRRTAGGVQSALRRQDRQAEMGFLLAAECS